MLMALQTGEGNVIRNLPSRNTVLLKLWCFGDLKRIYFYFDRLNCHR